MLDNDYLNYTFLTAFLVSTIYFFFLIYQKTKNVITFLKETKDTLEPIKDGVTNVNDILKDNTDNITNGIASISSTLSGLELLVRKFVERVSNASSNKPNVNAIKTD